MTIPANPSGEMAERVRHAIENASVPHPRGDGERSLHYYAQVGADSFDHDPSGALIRALIVTAAYAAIVAMREPTEAMEVGGLQMLPFGPSSPAVAGNCYRAMIDTALTQPKEG